MGNTTLEKLQVVIEGTIAPYKKAVDEAKKQTKSMTNSINKDIAGIKNPARQILESDKDFVQMKKTLGNTFANLKNGNIAKDIGNSIYGKVNDKIGNITEKFRDFQVNSGLKEYTEEYEQTIDYMKRTEKVLDRLKEKQKEMDASQIDKQSDAWRNNEREIARAEERLDHYIAHSNRLKMSGQGLQSIGLKKAAGSIASKSFSGMKSVFDRVTGAVKKSGGAFASLIQKFRTGIPQINKTKNSMKGFGNTGRGLSGILKTLGMTARFMFASFVISGAVNGAKEGMQNLAQYSSQTNASLSILMSSLTQLKNSLTTAFAPILNVVAPMLNLLMQKVSQAATSIGMLFASLTGQKSFVKATKVSQDYAASLKSGTSNAKKANDANQKLQKTLLGFDQINRMDDNSDSGAADTGDAGNLGGLPPSDMFETVSIPNQIKDFADQIKEAWKNADFTDIGRIVGEKLNHALENIQWDKIRATSSKIAKSIATFLNGFIGETNWELVGSTLGNALNTVIDFGYTFVTTFDWKKFGQAISDFINGSVKTVDWGKAGKTISEGVKGILDTIIQAIQNTDWKQIGVAIGTFLGNIDWRGNITKLLTAVASIPKAIFDAISGAIETIDWGQIVKDIAGGIRDFLVGFDWKGTFESAGELIGAAMKALFDVGQVIGETLANAIESAKDYFQDKIEECGGNIVLGILKGIKDGLLNIGKWVVDNIFQPFIDGFKEAFGIHSPSTVMEEQGGYIITGLLNGLVNNVKDVIEWCKALPSNVKDALGDAKEWLIQKGKDAIEGIKNGYESVKDGTLLSKFRKLKEDTFSSVGDISGKLKKKGSDAISGIKQGYENSKQSGLLSKVATLKENIYTSIGNVSEKVKGKGREVVSGFKSGYENNKSQIGSAVSGIPNLISRSIGNLYQVGSSAMSSFARGFASIHIPTPHIGWNWNSIRLGKTSFSVPSFNVNWYASGGFPENGEMFVAREAGPEMVGRMGKKNAVANNNQIIEGIKAGVFEAVMDAFNASGAFNQKSQEKNVTLELLIKADSETLYRVVRKGKQKYDGRYMIVEEI